MRSTALLLIAGLTALSAGVPQAPASAQEARCLMGAAVPCPPIGYLDWWVGAWATRMEDPSGVPLTAFTRLRPDGTYKSTLDYADGRRVEHWGSYEIRFPKGPASVSRIQVGKIRDEAAAIQRGVESSNVKTEVVNLMAAAIPNDNVPCDCASGRIVYHVQGSSPPDLDFPSPQVFNFIQQGEGYVRVWGPGVEGRLGRRYANR